MLIPMQPSDWPAIARFKPSEFNHPNKMERQFIAELNALAIAVEESAGYRVPMIVSSDYRTPEYNAEVGGAPDSAHCDNPCRAVDLAPKTSQDRYWILRVAFMIGWKRIEVATKDGHIHLDTTYDRRPAPVFFTHS